MTRAVPHPLSLCLLLLGVVTCWAIRGEPACSVLPTRVAFAADSECKACVVVTPTGPRLMKCCCMLCATDCDIESAPARTPGEPAILAVTPSVPAKPVLMDPSRPCLPEVRAESGASSRSAFPSTHRRLAVLQRWLI